MDVDRQTEFFEASWAPSRYQKILVDEILVGVLVRTVDDNQVVLDEIQIDPDHQGRGLGTKVMHDVIRDADSAGILFDSRCC